MKFDLTLYSYSVRKDYGRFYNSCKRCRIEPRVSITTELQRGSRELIPYSLYFTSVAFSHYCYYKVRKGAVFLVRIRFVLYIVVVRIKTPEKRQYLDGFQSEGLFFFCINEMRFAGV